jgi:hypothetical protein
LAHETTTCNVSIKLATYLLTYLLTYITVRLRSALPEHLPKQTSLCVVGGGQEVAAQEALLIIYLVKLVGGVVQCVWCDALSSHASAASSVF